MGSLLFTGDEQKVHMMPYETDLKTIIFSKIIQANACGAIR